MVLVSGSMQISDWFLVEHEKMDENFPDLPPEEEGGSNAITKSEILEAIDPKGKGLKETSKIKTPPPGAKGNFNLVHKCDLSCHKMPLIKEYERIYLAPLSPNHLVF